MCAKYYENPTMLSEVTAKNVGDVFLRHTVETDTSATQWAGPMAREQLHVGLVLADPRMWNMLLASWHLGTIIRALAGCLFKARFH